MSNYPPEDQRLIDLLCNRDTEFRRMWEDHLAMKNKLKEMQNIKYPTEEEEMQMKKLKKEKLRGKDRIEERIRVARLSQSG